MTTRTTTAPDPGAPLPPGGGPDEKPAPTSPRRRRSSWFVLLCALLFFFTPVLAAGVGVRAKQIENRRLAAGPSISDGWGAFGKLSTWANDHLPLRDKAVKADTQFSEKVFGQPPSYGGENSEGDPTVVLGRDGFVFYGTDFTDACKPRASYADIKRNADRFVAIAHKAGAEVELFVAPDKTSIETSSLPGRFTNKRCGTAAKNAFWAHLQADPPAAYVDLYQSLRELRTATGAPIYKTKDTHWAPRSSALYTQKLVDRLDPRLWQTTTLTDVGDVTRIGDLTQLSGAPQNNTYRNFETRREGVTITPFRRAVGSDRLGVAGTHAHTTGAPVYEPPTLFLADSFTGTSVPQLQPFFATMTSAQINVAATRPAGLAQLLLTHKLVVFESVERAFATGRLPLLTDNVLNALDREVDRQLALSSGRPKK